VGGVGGFFFFFWVGGGGVSAHVRASSNGREMTISTYPSLRGDLLLSHLLLPLLRSVPPAVSSSFTLLLPCFCFSSIYPSFRYPPTFDQGFKGLLCSTIVNDPEECHAPCFLPKHHSRSSRPTFLVEDCLATWTSEPELIIPSVSLIS